MEEPKLMCLFTSEVRQRLLSPCRIFALSCFKGSFTERLRIIVLRGLILSLMHLGLIVGDEFRQKKSWILKIIKVWFIFLLLLLWELTKLGFQWIPKLYCWTALFSSKYQYIIFVEFRIDLKSLMNLWQAYGETLKKDIYVIQHSPAAVEFDRPDRAEK